VLAVGLMAGALSSCGGSASRGSASAPSGTYTTTISETEQLGALATGTWTVTFGKHGTYTVSKGQATGLSTGPGSYYTANTFVITPLSERAHPCGPGSARGVYRLKVSGEKLTFVRTADICTLRSSILAHTFTKAH
jgi:hypothetical protein